MSKSAEHYDKEGFLLDQYGKRVVRDGEFVRVNLQLSDSKPKPADKPKFDYADARPKSATVTDEDRARRQKLYDALDEKLSNAWRGNKG